MARVKKIPCYNPGALQRAESKISKLEKALKSAQKECSDETAKVVHLMRKVGNFRRNNDDLNIIVEKLQEEIKEEEKRSQYWIRRSQLLREALSVVHPPVQAPAKQCCICLEEVARHAYVGCGRVKHFGCFECIRAWELESVRADQTHDCPMCKARVSIYVQETCE